MREGELIDGRFELEKLAGAGGSGSVYRAVDRSTGERVALKLLSRLDWPLQRFAREASILSELEHPGIVRYVAHGVADCNTPYLAIEWLEGQTLTRALSAREKLMPADAVPLVLAASRALAVAHARGIVHRDVKPSNLFVIGTGLSRLKVIDFGLARSALLAEALTRIGAVVGTPGYMAPEQVRGDAEVGPAADVFSLGCVLFECLTGHSPFSGRHATAIFTKILIEPAPRLRDSQRHVSQRLDDLVDRMLAKSSERRPRDAHVVAEELAALLEQERRSPRASSAPPSLTRREQGLLCVLMSRIAYEPVPKTRAPGTPEFTANQRLRAIAQRYGGELEFLSNGVVVVVFEPHASTPLAATDLAGQAAQCALALQRVMPSAPLALGTGTGIAAAAVRIGEVIDRVAALLHSQLSERESKTSDTSELVTEQEAEHASPRVRIDPAMAGLLENRFEVIAHEAGEAFLIGSKRERDAGRLLLGKATPCVGRERELSELESLLDECIDENLARVALITAPAGVGKSRLRHEFTRRIRERAQAVRVWQAWGEANRAGSPLALLAGAARGALALEEGEPQEMSRAKIRARIERVVDESHVTRVSEFLGELVGVRFPDSPQLIAARREPRLMGDQIARAWHDWLAGVCADAPLVLILEDLHWGDWGSLKLVDSVLRQLHEQRLFVLALGRPEVRELFPGIWQERNLEHMSLRLLSKRASAELVCEILGEEPSSSRTERIVSRADGNAFYLEELIRAEAEGKSDELPITVLAMIQTRLARLPADSRRLLRAASIFGESFWKGGVAALSPAIMPRTLDERLQELAAAEWLLAHPESRIAHEREYGFRHALLRDAAYATLTDEDRVLGHGLAGTWLERSGERDPVTLAEHFRLAGELPRAVSWYERAAALALKSDHQGAIHHAERAIECGAAGSMLGRLRLIQAEAHNWRGEHSQAAQLGAQALQHLAADGADAERWAHAANQTIWANGSLSKCAELTPLARLLFERAREHRTDLHILAVAMAAGHVLDAGDAQAAEEMLQWAQEHVVKSEDPLVTGGVKFSLANKKIRSNAPEAIRLFEAARLDFQEAEDAQQVHHSVYNAGLALIMLGQYERAESAFRSALEISDRRGGSSFHTLANLGVATTRLGRAVEGRALLEQALEESQRHESPRITGYLLVMLAELQIEAGEFETAADNAERAVDAGGPPLQAFALSTLTRARIAGGRIDAALESARRAVALAESGVNIDEYSALVHSVHAEALHAGGEHESARAALALARDTLLSAADCIDDPALRQSFLGRIPENARMLALARAWLPHDANQPIR